MIYLLALLLFSCSLEPKIAPAFNIPLTGVSTVEGAIQWTARNISYQADPTRDYWKTPEETYADRTGDCEDYALLAMYLINKEIGKNTTFILGWQTSMTVGPCHAWLMCEGQDLDPIGGIIGRTWMRDNFHDVIEIYDYDTAMNLAYVRHSRRLKDVRSN